MKPFLSRPRPYLVAHRGGAALAPENTVAAFDGASRIGADALELDVHLTRDGEVVVFHDATTERITGVAGTVARRTLAELRSLDAGWSFTPDGGATFPWRGRGLVIPRLAELFDRYPAMLFNIEAKDPQPPLAEALARLIRARECVHSVCIGSFNDAQGERLRRLLPEACHFLPERAAACHVYAARAGASGSGCPQGYDVADLPLKLEDGTPVVDSTVVDYFHAREMLVHVWTVNDEAAMRSLIDMGSDGIMTDRPDVLKRVLQRSSTGPGAGC